MTKEALEALDRCELSMFNAIKSVVSIAPHDSFVKDALSTIESDVKTIRAALTPQHMDLEGLKKEALDEYMKGREHSKDLRYIAFEIISETFNWVEMKGYFSIKPEPVDLSSLHREIFLHEDFSLTMQAREAVYWVLNHLVTRGLIAANTRADQYIPDGCALMPIEPSDEMWDGLARAIVMGRDLGCYRTDEMRKHLERSGYEIQDWLDLELSGTRHLSKGDMCVLIYKAMFAARPNIGS